LQLGGWQKVSQAERVANGTIVGQEVTTRAARGTGGWLRLFADQQRGKVHRWNFDIPDDKARHGDGTLQDNQLGSIGQRHDKIATGNRDLVDIRSGGKDHNTIRVGRDGMHSARLVRRTPHPRSHRGKFGVRRLLAISGRINIPVPIEIHCSIPTCHQGTTWKKSAREHLPSLDALESINLFNSWHSGSAIAPCLRLPPTEPESGFDRPGLSHNLFFT
jgi:hypothetical protein